MQSAIKPAGSGAGQDGSYPTNTVDDGTTGNASDATGSGVHSHESALPHAAGTGADD